MGGDCLNTGCVPSKALLAASHAGAGLDWMRYDANVKVGDIIARKDPGYQRLIRMYTPEQTVGDFLRDLERAATNRSAEKLGKASRRDPASPKT